MYDNMRVYYYIMVALGLGAICSDELENDILVAGRTGCERARKYKNERMEEQTRMNDVKSNCLLEHINSDFTRWGRQR
jgi:hypothetical protein